MKPKILVADDDADIARILCEWLKVSGYATLMAHDGLTAVEIARRESPNIILLDWRMPSGTGAAVLQMLSEREETKNIPVFVLSGILDVGMIQTALKMGAREVIQKPYDADDLLKKIRSLLP